MLVVGRDGPTLLGPHADAARTTPATPRSRRGWGRVWMDIGTGAWDSQRRPSEVRLDRVLRLPPSAVRREGATVDRALFDRVAAALRTTQSW